MATVARPENRLPSRSGAAIFWLKATVLKARRAVFDVRGGLRRLDRGELNEYPVVVAESVTPLWDQSEHAERAMQIGKVHNLRLAVRSLNGAVLGRGVFSFWKEVGRCTRGRGFVAGRQLREGCLYPAVGGGLCQLSNALYDLARRSGLEVLERHRHSQAVPGSAAERGEDATVAWNYVDLRFASDRELLLEARLTSGELVLRLRSRSAQAVETSGPPPPAPPPKRTTWRRRVTLQALQMVSDVHSCMSCGEDECFRHEAANVIPKSTSERTAYLVDELWPEFDLFIKERRSDVDVLAIPLAPFFKKPQYSWSTAGFAKVGTASLETLKRSYTSRRLGKYGASRLQAQLSASESLARAYAKLLSHEVTHVVVMQSLLPYLWRDGLLGGRTFDVLMTRLPLDVMQSRLDAEVARRPESKTLAEFRAPEWLVSAERGALDAATRVITPHSEIASFFEERAVKLEWRLPAAIATTPGRVVAFPGPTAGRKGAYEVREACADRELLLLGSELEGPSFWDGLNTRRKGETHWLEGVGAVVQPALIEDRPRPLLQAIAHGVPVVVTSHCGLGGMGVIEVPFGDVEALSEAVARALVQRPGR